jgi:hypothetical protein
VVPDFSRSPSLLLIISGDHQQVRRGMAFDGSADLNFPATATCPRFLALLLPLDSSLDMFRKDG